MNITEELNALEISINQSKRELSEAEGSIKTLMKRLKDEEGINSLEEGEKVLKKLSKDISSLEEGILSKLDSLKEIYDY